MKNKEVIYIDVDDEITGIIDKVNSAKEKIVALVLPKRAAVFQSIVNLKLLQKSANSHHKKVVLVTSEASLLPLAGAVGMYIAHTLESAPEIPSSPDVSDKPLSVTEEVDEEEPDLSKPVGVLAGLTPIPIPRAKPEDDSIELDNEEKPAETSHLTSDAKKIKNKTPKQKKIKVPNFEKFRTRLILGSTLLVILVVGWVLAFVVLPKATITIKTNTTQISSNQNVTFSTTQKALDPVNLIVPAKMAQIQKTVTSPQVNTTGQKQVGTSASGTMTISNDQDQNTHTVPIGTIFTTQDSAGNNINFTTTASGTVPGVSCATFYPFTCTPGKSQPIPVQASGVGTDYNISATTNYTTNDSDLSGNFTFSGSAMSGGSSQTVQAVTQQDIANAQQQISSPNSNQIETQLEQQLQQQGLFAVAATFSNGTPSFNPSADVDAQANTVTVTGTFTYTMFGVNKNDLNTIVNNYINQQINSKSQSILDNGLNQASYQVLNSTSNSVQLAMQDTATIGPKIDLNTLKKQVAGQKSGDIVAMINQIPGVTNVNVHYSPFWVTSTPKSTSKIKIIIEKSNGNSP